MCFCRIIRSEPTSVPALSKKVLLGKRNAATRSARFTNSILINGEAEFIITSQYPSSSWYDMVGEPTVADAILDRIVHSAHSIEPAGESMRKLKAKKA